MLFRDDLGREEGYLVGPEPGKGAVVFTCSGEEDFDGLPGDVLPPGRSTAEWQNLREPGRTLDADESRTRPSAAQA
jgi:hypothetical protein